MNPNKIIIVLLCLLCGGRLGAQGQHELSGSIGGSVSFLNYDPAAVNGFSFGGTAGIGYAYLGEHWGIGVGMNAAMYSGKYSASISGATPDLYDSDRDPFTLRYELKDYREVQQIWMLSLPLMLRYHTGMFHAALGGRAGFPFYASYTSQTSTLTTYGVFNAPSIPTLYDPANKGFGKYDDIKSNGTLGLDWAAAFFASAEVGVRWEAGSVAFYTSIYADYALNNIYKKTDNLKPFVGFDNRPDRDYNINPYRPNSVLASHTGNGSEALVSKVNPLSVGIKITVVLFQSDPDYVPAPPTPRPAAQASSGQSRSSGGGGSAAPRRSALGDPSPLEIKPHGDAEVCLYIVGASKKLDNAIIEPPVLRTLGCRP